MDYDQLIIGSLEHTKTVEACDKELQRIFNDKTSTPEQCSAQIWLLEMLVKEGRLYHK